MKSKVSFINKCRIGNHWG